MPTIRTETKADFDAIRAVNDAAFAGAQEGRIVEALRQAGELTVSLVAEEQGRIIGHVAFSPVTIENNPSNSPLLGLGPMAVDPEFQKKGIGSKLIRKGLERAKAGGFHAVFVLGHPTYYSKFGFVPSFPFDIAWEIDCPKEAFMVLELEGGVLTALSGKVKYHPAFMEV